MRKMEENITLCDVLNSDIYHRLRSLLTILDFNMLFRVSKNIRNCVRQRYTLKKHPVDKKNVCTQAAKYGYLGVLNWGLRELKIEWSDNITLLAVKYHNLNILQYIWKTRRKIYYRATNIAALCGF